MDSGDALLRASEVAQRLGYAPKTLANWRSRGIGPRVTTLPSGGIRYATRDVRAWAQGIEQEPSQLARETAERALRQLD